MKKITGYEVWYYNSQGQLAVTDKKKYYKPLETAEDQIVHVVYPDVRKGADTITREDLIGFLLIIKTTKGKYVFHSDGIKPK